MIFCGWCGSAVERPRHPMQRYCERWCKERAARQRHRPPKGIVILHRQHKERCRLCEQWYRPRHADHWYCRDLCRKRAWMRKNGERRAFRACARCGIGFAYRRYKEYSPHCRSCQRRAAWDTRRRNKGVRA